MQIPTVNESPAAYFYKQMRIRKKLAFREWKEPRSPSFDCSSIGRGEYLELHPSLQLSFPDYWETERNRAFYDMTRDCICILLSLREDAQN